MNTWPQSFPCPQLDGSALTADTMLAATPVGATPVEVRQMQPRFPHAISVALIADQSTYGRLLPWLNRFGVHWFEMPLTTFQGHMLPQIVRFKSDFGQELVMTAKGPYWRITGDLEWLPH